MLTTLPETLLYVVYGLVVLGGAVVGAFGSSVVARGGSMLVWRDLSRAAVFRIRIIGGIAGAIIAYLLLGTPGFGPGRGGLPGQNPGTSEQTEKQLPDSPLASRPLQQQSLTDATSAEAVGTIRVKLLGEKTEPPYQPPDRYFALASDPGAPGPQAANVGTIMERVKALQAEGKVKEIDLTVSPQSTSLQHIEVQRLRQRVQELGLRFYAPDPENPFGGKKE